MLLRHAHDVAGLFREGRAQHGWSQSDLAERVGVSRQWISMVENEKTSVEFDLVLAALQALGYYLHATTYEEGVTTGPSLRRSRGRVKADRTALTRNGVPLGYRTRRYVRDVPSRGDDA